MTQVYCPIGYWVDIRECESCPYHDDSMCKYREVDEDEGARDGWQRLHRN